MNREGEERKNTHRGNRKVRESRVRTDRERTYREHYRKSVKGDKNRENCNRLKKNTEGTQRENPQIEKTNIKEEIENRTERKRERQREGELGNESAGRKIKKGERRE